MSNNDFKEKRICSKPGCNIKLSIYNNNKENLCFCCQDGGKERIFCDSICYTRRSTSESRVVGVNRRYHG